MKQPLPAILLTVLALGAAPWPARFEQRAVRYLDNKVVPRPPVLSGPEPNFEEFTYLWHRCWGVREGLVCEACYAHPKHYLGQMAVLCPWNRALCRWVVDVPEEEKLGVEGW